MNKHIIYIDHYVTSLEAEQSAIALALHAAGVPEHIDFDDGKGKTLNLAERVEYALHRGPAFKELFQDSADLQRLLSAIDAQPPGVEGALLWLQALRDCPPAPADLRGKIAHALNCHSAENASSTPDYVLADFLLGCLAGWDAGVKAREAWHGRPAPARDCSGPFMPAPGRADLDGELACERHGTACPAPEVVESKPEPTPDGHVCPGCGAAEVEALDTARTVYACGSNDYDHRPETFLWSTRCWRDAYAAARKNAEPKPELPTVGTYQVSGIPGVAEIKVCENGSLRIKWNGSPAFYFSVDTFADVTARHPNAVWTKVSNE